MKFFRGHIFFFFVVAFCSSFAQTHVIDSLRNALKARPDDTNRVNTLNILSDKLWRLGKYDSSANCAGTAKALSQKIGYKKGIAGACRNLGIVCWYRGDYPGAIKYDSTSLTIAEEIGDRNGIGANLGNIGLVYSYQGNYPRALEFYNKAVAISQEMGNKRSMAAQLGNIGSVYLNEGNYPKALEYDLKALGIYNQSENKYGIANALGNVGNVYYMQKNYPKALEYDSLSLAAYKQLGEKDGVANELCGAGSIYSYEGEYEKALKFDMMALDIYRQIGDKKGISIDLGNIGNVYHLLGNYANSIDYLEKAMQMQKQLGDKEGIARNLGNIGNTYFKEKKYDLAGKYLDSAIALGKSIGAKEQVKNSYEYLFELNIASGNYKEGFEDYKKFIAYRDSLSNEENTKKTVQAEMNYQFEQKQAAEKAEQDKKDAIAASDKKRQQIITAMISACLVLVLLFSGLLFSRYRLTHRQKRIIEEQKSLVEEKNKEVLDSITYAKRLQDAILPPLSLIKRHLPQSFVLYKPKDIVAGDFYWMETAGDTLLVAAADCTGHGVPGAMVSVVCSNALNRTVKEFHITEPGKILDKVRELVIETFEKSETNVQDGMDISLLSLTPCKEGIDISWAGAYNSLWYTGIGEIKELEADKQPIGKTDSPKPFTTHSFTISNQLGELSGSCIYLFTDGYADQFGGPKGKKFKYKQMQELLLANAGKSMEEQGKILDEAINAWMGELEQVDDVLVMGIRI